MKHVHVSLMQLLASKHAPRLYCPQWHAPVTTWMKRCSLYFLPPHLHLIWQMWAWRHHQANLPSGWASAVEFLCCVSIQKFSRKTSPFSRVSRVFFLIVLHQLRLFSNVPDYLWTFLSYECLLFTEFRKSKALISLAKKVTTFFQSIFCVTRLPKLHVKEPQFSRVSRDRDSAISRSGCDGDDEDGYSCPPWALDERLDGSLGSTSGLQNWDIISWHTCTQN